MNTTAEIDLSAHTPVAWYWEAGSEHCPHGTEPDRDSDAWDVWAERHTGSPQDVFVCLDAPMGEVCDACSEETSDPIPMTACRARAHAHPTPEADATKYKRSEHQPVTVWVGTFECIERECEEYFDDEGNDRPEVERCSHIGTEVICNACSVLVHGDYYEPTVPWPGPHTAPAPAPAV